MINKNDIIYKMLAHPKCKQGNRGNIVTFRLNGLVFEVPKNLGKKITQFMKKRKYNLLRQLIVIYKDRFITNFGD